MKSPTLQWYPGDWRRDLALQSCSLRQRGLWAEMLWLMHDGVPYGHLATVEGPIVAPVLARMVGAPLRDVVADLAQLKAAGVYSITPAGVIYSRRMVRDQALRERRAAFGPLGGHDHETAVAYGKRGGRPRKKAHGGFEGGFENPHQGGVDGGYTKTPPASASASAVTDTPLPPSRGASTLLLGFDQFKATYPRRENWRDAEKAWRQVGASPWLAAILADIRRRLDAREWEPAVKDRRRFIPMPASYLRARRWEDEVHGDASEEDPYAGQPHLWDCACGEVHEGVRGQPRPPCPNRPQTDG